MYNALKVVKRLCKKSALEAEMLVHSRKKEVMKEEIKYDKSEEAWDKALNDKDRNKVALTWLNQNPTLDRWRHDRMYDHLKPVVEFNNEISWLTVGDGRYGTDANALFRLGATNVMCTDISDKMLDIARKKAKNMSIPFILDDPPIPFPLGKKSFLLFKLL